MKTEKFNRKSGFTLAELLIVVAIIAVLVAVAVPVFTTQLAKSQLATDTANTRAAYAEATATALAEGSLTTSGKIKVSFTDPCKYGNASEDNDAHKVTITHNNNDPDKGNLINSFEIDDDVVLKINSKATG